MDKLKTRAEPTLGSTGHAPAGHKRGDDNAWALDSATSQASHENLSTSQSRHGILQKSHSGQNELSMSQPSHENVRMSVSSHENLANPQSSHENLAQTRVVIVNASEVLSPGHTQIEDCAHNKVHTIVTELYFTNKVLFMSLAEQTISGTQTRKKKNKLRKFKAFIQNNKILSNSKILFYIRLLHRLNTNKQVKYKYNKLYN